MELFLLYLFTRVDAVKYALVWATVFPLIVFLICYVGGAISKVDGDDATGATLHKHMKIPLAIGLLCLMVNTATPTQKDLAIVLAGWGVIEIAQSETAQRLASKSVRIIEETLDGYLNENKPAKEAK